MGACAQRLQPDPPPSSPTSPTIRYLVTGEKPGIGLGGSSSPSRRPAISAAAAAASRGLQAPADSQTPGDAEPTRRRTGDRGFIRCNDGCINDAYDMSTKRIGTGSYGAVVKGVHRETKQARAIKIIPKKKVVNLKKLRDEVEIMKIMDHPNVIKLFETFQDKKTYFLAMELCTGRELFDKILESTSLTERDAAIVAQQILRSIWYIHDRGVAHRDLKPENFLFVNKDPIESNVLKLIDFGLSKWFVPGDVMSTRAGTPYYVAPEVLAGSYKASCDIWSVGVIVYILICGVPPFHGKDDREILTKVKRGNFSFKSHEWDLVSADVKDLIRHLLKYKPEDRFTAEKALNHDWIVHSAPRATTDSLAANTVMQNLQNFRSQNRLKKAALQVIATQLDDTQIANLRQTFTALDANGDGLLTFAELEGGLDRAGVERTDDLQEILEAMDTDGSGVVDYTEFIAAALDRCHHVDQHVCWTAFKVFDLNNDGQISLDELRKVLSSDNEDVANIEAILQDVDTDGDGTIDFNEFMAMMSHDSAKRWRDSLSNLPIARGVAL